MNNPAKQFIDNRVTLLLPKIARTRSGVEFSPRDEVWCFRDGVAQVSLNFFLIPNVFSPLLYGLKKTLLWYLENRAPNTANVIYSSFLWLIRHIDDGSGNTVERIRPEDILAIKMESDNAEYRLALTRYFLIKWSELGWGGVGSDVAYLLTRLTLKEKPSGVAVSTLDPKSGPFTDFEFEAIQTSINMAYAQGKIDVEHLLLCYLLMSLGVRPVQLALLKCSDLIVPKLPDGDYVLKVPRVKQKNSLPRNEFKWRKLTRQIGEPLAAYVETIKSEFSTLLEDAGEAPLFPQRINVNNTNAPGFLYHTTGNILSKRVLTLFSGLQVYSERLESSMPVSSLRFRRTFATRAAEEGFPLLVIAELLDHSNTKHVKVYSGLTDRIRAVFSRKIALDMAPLARAFSGKIIRNEDNATRPGMTSRIIDFRIDRTGAGMGSCGSHVHCGFARPMACYGGCYEFEPWLDGPHEAALDYMIARREQLMVTTDIRIASINDRAILGCAQVILRCRQIIKEEKNDCPD